MVRKRVANGVGQLRKLRVKNWGVVVGGILGSVRKNEEESRMCWWMVRG